MPVVTGTAQLRGPMSALDDLHEAIGLLPDHAKVSGIIASDDYIGHAFSYGEIPQGVYVTGSTIDRGSSPKLEVSINAMTSDAASKFLQGLASSFNLNVHWIHSESGKTHQKTDLFSAMPVCTPWRLRTRHELEASLFAQCRDESFGTSRISRNMNLSAGARTQNSAAPIIPSRYWSAETEQCLRDLNMVLMAYGEAARTLKLPGVGEMYSKLQELISDINTGGPKVLADCVEKASTYASTVFQVLK